jgi:hypothetical protein
MAWLGRPAGIGRERKTGSQSEESADYGWNARATEIWRCSARI